MASHEKLVALQGELEAERLRSQEAHCHFAQEALKVRTAAERERQLLSNKLRSKWEQERARELQQVKETNLRERKAEIRQLLCWKDAELRQAQELLRRERDTAMRWARIYQSEAGKEVGRYNGQDLIGKAYAKLQEMRGKSLWYINRKQAACIRHLKAELEMERSLFLKYILQCFKGEQPTLGFLQRGPSDHPEVAKSLKENQLAENSQLSPVNV